MKKLILIFCSVFFANTSNVWAAYFYADALTDAIQETFPSNIWSDVANEYMAQMNPTTGEIDAAGMNNVCYVGGMDVATADGAEKCDAFVKNIASKCVYAYKAGKILYTNPQTEEQKIQKCIFDDAIDYALIYENGFQQTPSDPGNRICGPDGKPIKDKNGDYLLGATKYGITTCASRLSVECIRKMTVADAKLFYWTRHYYKYKYYNLPPQVLAAVMQLSVGGVGIAAAELRETVGANCGATSVMTDCVANAVNQYLETHTLEEFYNAISNKRAAKRSGQARERALLMSSALKDSYLRCAAKYKF
ncbi:MAG: glycosyl hydrolase 108 family protein [Alphaproteobacteria bacterium]